MEEGVFSSVTANRFASSGEGSETPEANLRIDKRTTATWGYAEVGRMITPEKLFAI
jgi:hypothetical protein